MNDYPTLELNDKTDKLSIDTQCPHCGDKYMTHVSYVNVPCGKCGTTYRTDFKQDMYTKIARKINSILFINDGLNIKATEKYAKDLFHIQKHFEGFNNWDVSEFEHKQIEIRRCNTCGVCTDCLTCKSCGTAFKKDPNRKKQKCTKCKSDSFVKTYFKKVDINRENHHIKKCPYCSSDNIIMTTTKNKTKCHLCNSKDLTEPRVDTEYSMVIERKRAYLIEKN